ncbi:MAG TPA: hypothetical protein VN942_01585 [Chthoniobacterales bacterium]|nr:hypothetical protein [Chthoniobacterales bacterium]
MKSRSKADYIQGVWRALHALGLGPVRQFLLFEGLPFAAGAELG